MADYYLPRLPAQAADPVGVADAIAPAVLLNPESTAYSETLWRFETDIALTDEQVTGLLALVSVEDPDQGRALSALTRDEAANTLYEATSDPTAEQQRDQILALTGQVNRLILLAAP
jgi:hypothetical protein